MQTLQALKGNGSGTKAILKLSSFLRKKSLVSKHLNRCHSVHLIPPICSSTTPVLCMVVPVLQ